jgi:hypothetical protein
MECQKTGHHGCEIRVNHGLRVNALLATTVD